MRAVSSVNQAIGKIDPTPSPFCFRLTKTDTLNYAYMRSQEAEVQEVVTGMTETLIRNKVLYRYRLLGKYFLVAVDGTGMLTHPV